MKRRPSIHSSILYKHQSRLLYCRSSPEQFLTRSSPIHSPSVTKDLHARHPGCWCCCAGKAQSPFVTFSTFAHLFPEDRFSDDDKGDSRWCCCAAPPPPPFRPPRDAGAVVPVAGYPASDDDMDEVRWRPPRRGSTIGMGNEDAYPWSFSVTERRSTGKSNYESSLLDLSHTLTVAAIAVLPHRDTL